VVREPAGWFGAIAPEDDNERVELTGLSRKNQLGYYSLDLGAEHRGETTIELPAGQIELSIADG
jgi:hypothetical protein